MYGDGKGVVQDYVAAHMWFNLAAKQGVADAVANREIAETAMTQQQISQAQKLARERLARNFKDC
jgi:TPR repeat protein